MKTTRTLNFLLLILAYTAWQCNDGGLDHLARKALKDNQGVTASEFAEIRNLIAGDADLKANYPDDSSISSYLDTLALAMSQAKRGAIRYPVVIETGEEKSEKSSFYIFFENSYSMDGYLRGRTEFIDAAFHLMTQIRLQKERINLFYINKDAYPVVTEFENYLKPERVSEFGRENRGNSEVNRILRIVADTVCKSPDRVAVVISDYLYSIRGHQVDDELDQQRHITTLNVSALPEKDYALLIMQVNSMFNGTYYDLNNKPSEISEMRPIFFWIMGKREKITRLIEDYHLRDARGYERHLMLVPAQKGNLPYYTILDRTFREGRFRKQNREGGKAYTAIEQIELSRDDRFKFAIAVDFSEMPVDASYLTDPEKYMLETDSGDKFRVKSIEPVEQIEHNDRDQKGTATHILVIELEGDRISVGNQTLTVSLIRRLPDWVQEISTENDVTESGRRGKTFGLSYLVGGAATAFGYNTESVYLSLPITIKN